MRDFGFWVRVVAITQISSLVLINFGQAWLADDSAVLTVPHQAITRDYADEAKRSPSIEQQAGARPADARVLGAEGWDNGHQYEPPSEEVLAEAAEAQAEAAAADRAETEAEAEADFAPEVGFEADDLAEPEEPGDGSQWGRSLAAGEAAT
jgi:hypothetical protein